jgi:copper homeostasis protein (lipoprotein)
VSRYPLPCLVALAMLSACAKPSAHSNSAPAETASSSMQPAKPLAAELTVSAPALFVGMLPCADCQGIRYQLDLHSPEAFFLRMTYLGKPVQKVFDEIGEWSAAADGKTLVLRGQHASPQMFSIEDAGSLRKLDMQGQPIVSELNYALARQPQYQALEPEARMRGMYRHDGSAVRLEECSTGLDLVVAEEGAATDLRAQYLKVESTADAATLVELDGRIVQRPREGGGAADTLIVEHVHGFWPSESCGARGVTHDLTNTRWVLVRLGEIPVVVRDDRREQFIALQSADRRVVGNAGCNRVNGSYEINGDGLTFSQLVTTRMACPDMQRESALVHALKATMRWSIDGAHLELFDESGALLARFESRNL